MALTSDQIERIIRNNVKNVSDFKRYERYYQGNNQYIQDKQAKDEPDKRIVLPFALKIINTVIGYMFKPGLVRFSTEVPEAEAFLEELKEIHNYNDEDLTNSEVAESMLAKGKAYKLFYITTEITEDGEKPGVINYVPVEPDNIIIEWTNELKPKMRAFYYYYDTCEIDQSGIDQRTTHFYEYTKKEINYYTAENSSNVFKQDKKNSKPNTIRELPLVEFYTGKDKRSIFSHVLSLIDEADELISTNFANEHATIGNAILMMSRWLDDEIKDSNGLTERDKFLTARYKTLEGMNKETGDFAEWLVKEIQWEGVFGAFDRIRGMVYDFAQIIDLYDPQWTNAESGQALLYRLTAFENKASMLESYYRRGLKSQIMKIAKMIKAKGGPDYTSVAGDIKITFERNLPKNKKEIAEFVNMLSMELSKKTRLEILEQADIIDDANEELEKVNSEIGELVIE